MCANAYSKKKLNEVLEKFEKIKFKINNLNHSEIDFIVSVALRSMKSILGFFVASRYKNCLVKNKKNVKNKENNYSYIVTTLIYLKNGNKIPFFSIQNGVTEENLDDHFKLMGIKSLNKIKIATLCR